MRIGLTGLSVGVRIRSPPASPEIQERRFLCPRAAPPLDSCAPWRPPPLNRIHLASPSRNHAVAGLDSMSPQFPAAQDRSQTPNGRDFGVRPKNGQEYRISQAAAWF